MEVTIWQALLALLAAMCIPSALTTHLFWRMERNITQRDKKREAEDESHRARAIEREKAREELELTLVESVNASLALAEATARAVERIPDAHCNGEMHRALEYASEVKHRQKGFLAKQGIKALVN